MGIIKLFSKYRDENSTSCALKYDQRRHSSISLFTIPNSAQQPKPNNKPRRSMAFEENTIRNRDSAIVTNIPEFVPLQNEESPDSVIDTFTPKMNRDVQNAVQTLRSESRDLSIQQAPGNYSRQNKSKSVSLNGIACTCHIPHIDGQTKSRVSAPIIKMDSSNKYEFSLNGKGDQKSSDNDIFGDIENLDHTLYSDLVAAQQTLQTIINNNSPFSNESIERVVNRLAYALEKSSYLESRLNTVIEVSKQTILHKAEQIKELEKQNESSVKSLNSALENNEALKSRLIETEGLITKIKYVLQENQIEPTEEEGGTILQQIESLLAISTSSYLFNEKLTSELEHSDKRILELMAQVDKLDITIIDLQKSQNNDEISDMKNKIVRLEEQIADLDNELRTSKDTIKLLDQEKADESAQLENSNSLLKQKISEMELYNNARIKSLEQENRRLREESAILREESAILREEKQIVISKQRATDRINAHIVNTQKNEIKKEKQNLEILTPNQNFSTEKCNSSIEKFKEQKSTDNSHILESTSNMISNEKDIDHPSDNIKDLQRTISQSSTRSQKTERLHIKNLQSAIPTDDTTGKNLVTTQDVEEELRDAEKREKDRQLITSKCSLLEFPEKRINKSDKAPLSYRSNRRNIQIQYFEKKHQKHHTEFSNLLMENSKVVQRMFNDDKDQLQQDMKMWNNNSLSPSAEKEVFEYAFKKKSIGFNNENFIALSKEKDALKNAVEAKESMYSAPLNIGFPTKIALSSSKQNDIDKTDESPLEYQLELITSLKQENDTLHELLDCLQNKVKAMAFGESSNKLQDTNTSTCKNLFFRGIESREQEELLKMHTRAQLGLIEYLEGEDNVSLAISRFRKLLEIQMKDFEY